MKIVVLGEGYVGSYYKKLGYTVLGKSDFFIRGNPYKITLGEVNEILHLYDVIINCIAKSNTRFCESNYQDAYLSNSLIPEILSNYCNYTNKKLVHISTGCLYDRNDVPQKETDFLAAHCNYTLTKWIGEKNCNPDRDLIVRPRLLFDKDDYQFNLINKLKRFNAFCNEYDSLTSVTVLIDAINALLNNNCTGIFNVACDIADNEGISMYFISRLMGLNKPKISIEEIRKQQGLHLVNCIMDLTKLKQFYQPPHIIDEINRCIN